MLQILFLCILITLSIFMSILKFLHEDKKYILPFTTYPPINLLTIDCNTQHWLPTVLLTPDIKASCMCLYWSQPYHQTLHWMLKGMKKKRHSTCSKMSKYRTQTLGYSLGFQKIEGTKTPNVINHTHVEKVILVSTIPSNLCIGCSREWRKKEIQLDRNRQKSHSDTGL